MTNAVRSKDTEIVVYLGLGSNLGDRAANLRKAIERIKALGLRINRESSIYETEPVGFQDQQWFLNQVIETNVPSPIAKQALSEPETIATVEAEALLSELLQIEQEMGRQRQIADGPRLIDVDLLLFGDFIIPHSKADFGNSKAATESLPDNQTRIVVPHPRMHLRRFVLEPMCEIGADVVHPILHRTCRELLSALDDESRVRVHRNAL